MKRTKVRELLREELLGMLANPQREDRQGEPPIRISESRLLRIVQEEIAREVDKISDSRDLLREATWEEFTGASDQWPIKQGHGGKWVKTIQAAIGAKTDGKFGPNTAKLLAAKAKGATEVDKALFGVLKRQTPTAVAARKEKEVGDKAVATHEKGKEAEAKAAVAAEKEAEAKKTGGEYNWHPSRPPYNLSAEEVERLWSKFVRSEDRNKARKDPGGSFVKGLKAKKFGIPNTDEGLVYAALYYGGGFKGIGKLNAKSKYALGKSAKDAVRGDFSGKQERLALWLGAADRRKVMSSDGELKKTERERS